MASNFSFSFFLEKSERVLGGAIWSLKSESDVNAWGPVSEI